MGNNPLFDVTTDEVPASITQSEWNEMRAQIADIHQFVRQLGMALGQASQNPLMRQMIPAHIRDSFGG